MKINSIFFAIVILLNGCTEISDDKIVGNWVTFDSRDGFNEPIDYRFIFRSDYTFEDVGDVEMDFDITGRWKKSGKKILIDYTDPGTGNEYRIVSVTDSTMVLYEDDQLLKFKRVKFRNDTLDHFDMTDLVVTDFDTKDTITAVVRGGEYWFWIYSPRLPEYPFNLSLRSGGVLNRTRKRGLYEIKIDSVAEGQILIEGQFDFKGDSIFVKRSQGSNFTFDLYDGRVSKAIHVLP